jgi:hypothetical protein
MEETLLWALFALVLLTVLLVGLYLLRHYPEAKARRRETLVAWLQEVEKDPRRLRLYRAHWRARWRTSFAMLLDLLLVFLPPLLSFPPWEGRLSRDEWALFSMGLFLLGFALLVYLPLKRLGTTLGLRLFRIVAVSPTTWKPARPADLPTRYDYRKDRVPHLLFVPMEELGEA